MENEILKTALAPGAECLSIEQLGDYADRALSAGEHAAAENHIRQCVNCQAELALFRAVTAPDIRAVKPSSWARRIRPRILPLAAVAAVAVIGIASSSLYLLRDRSVPQLPSRISTTGEATRSLAVAVEGPIGEQVEAPRRFEWRAVDGAVRYRVRLMEVDRHEVWSTSTSALAVDLPSQVRSSIVPARTLMWDVTAYDAANAVVAESGPQSFRLTPR